MKVLGWGGRDVWKEARETGALGRHGKQRERVALRRHQLPAPGKGSPVDGGMERLEKVSQLSE